MISMNAASDTKRNGRFERLESLVLRDRQVEDLTTLSRATRWRLEREGKFPQRIKLGPRACAWRRRDILAWIESRQGVVRSA
jgi:prophage regulatory protein